MKKIFFALIILICATAVLSAENDTFDYAKGVLTLEDLEKIDTTKLTDTNLAGVENNPDLYNKILEKANEQGLSESIAVQNLVAKNYGMNSVNIFDTRTTITNGVLLTSIGQRFTLKKGITDSIIVDDLGQISISKKPTGKSLFFYGDRIGEIKLSATQANAFEVTTKEGQKITVDNSINTIEYKKSEDPEVQKIFIMTDDYKTADITRNLQELEPGDNLEISQKTDGTLLLKQSVLGTEHTLELKGMGDLADYKTYHTQISINLDKGADAEHKIITKIDGLSVKFNNNLKVERKGEKTDVNGIDYVIGANNVNIDSALKSGNRRTLRKTPVTTEVTYDSATNTIKSLNSSGTITTDVYNPPKGFENMVIKGKQTLEFNNNGTFERGEVNKGGRMQYTLLNANGNVSKAMYTKEKLALLTNSNQTAPANTNSLLLDAKGEKVNIDGAGFVKLDKDKIADLAVTGKLIVQDNTEGDTFVDVQQESGKESSVIIGTNISTTYDKLRCKGSSSPTGKAITGMQIADYREGACQLVSTQTSDAMKKYEDKKVYVEKEIYAMNLIPEESLEEVKASSDGLTIEANGRELSIDKTYVVGEGKGEKYIMYKYEEQDGEYKYSDNPFVTLYVIKNPKTGNYIKLNPAEYSSIVRNLKLLDNEQITYAVEKLSQQEAAKPVTEEAMPQEQKQPYKLTEEEKERRVNELLKSLGIKTEQRPTDLKKIQENIANFQESARREPKINVIAGGISYVPESGKATNGWISKVYLESQDITIDEFGTLPMSEQAIIVNKATQESYEEQKKAEPCMNCLYSTVYEEPFPEDYINVLKLREKKELETAAK